jgi:hypothetical protein
MHVRARDPVLLKILWTKIPETFLPSFQDVAFFVREFSDDDNDEINQDPDSEKSGNGYDLQYTRPNLADIESVNSQTAKKETQQQCYQSFFIGYSSHFESPFMVLDD